MKLIVAFFKLIRWPNLFFIALTQSLFYFCVFYSLSTGETHAYRDTLFFLLMISSVLIAAAGYIINDYFDMQIDAVNKPGKLIVDKVIKRRWAILLHGLFSMGGIVISGYVSLHTGKWIILIVNICCVLLLWFYSTYFKKRLLAGNIIISALTAWVIIVVYFFAGAGLIDINGWEQSQYPFDIRKFFKLTMLYAGFAFIVSLVREVVKDLEDMEGDSKYNCKTMPIVWGIRATKVFAAVWLVVCIASLFIVQLYAWQSGWWMSAVFCILFIILPLVFILQRLYKANKSPDYHRISILIKLVMLSGILTMIFFSVFSV
ncbi:MAG TPA: geranylgeranylglycerol-phosphate geranylgeranyltransferase [Ferruginibacter sp.]|nr:geranylgeranylglycerol-phosphate geranylgeranyltransferase [Ferruginibacter sp.]